MIKIIGGDLFETDARLICHQVNCQSKMGSGVALQVKQKYPHVFKKYVEYCKSNNELLGMVLMVPSDPNCISDCGSVFDTSSHTICNLFAQDRYGYDGKCYTSYEALQQCLEYVNSVTYRKNNHYNATIAMPYLMGCHRGGGDWERVYKMIEDTFSERNVILYKRGG